MNSYSSIKLLKEVKQVMSHLNIPFFLSCGTLLGAIRENDFINHDIDIDIGIFIKDWQGDISKELQKAGFTFTRKLGSSIYGLEYTFRKYDINLDIFFYYEEKDYLWYAAWWKENTPENIIQLRFDKFSLEPYSFKGETFMVPSNPTHYLETLYGSDWEISNPKWHWAAGPRNIIKAPFDNKKKKTVCLGMIIKNEGHILRETLLAAKPLIDCYSICDTGSTDNSKAIIQEVLGDIPGEVIDTPWVNFGHNRTLSFQHAQKKADYVLILDGDTIINGEINKYNLISDSYNIKMTGNPTYYLPLLFKSTLNWKSVGVTHEYWDCKEKHNREVLPDVFIIHKCCGDYRKSKFENDIKLLLQGLKDEPTNSRYMFYLAQSYKDTSNNDKAIEWYKKRIVEGGWVAEVSYAYQMIVKCLIRKGASFKDIQKAALEAYSYDPLSAEALYWFLRYCRENKYYSVGYAIGKLAEIIDPPKVYLFMDPTIYKYKLQDELSICAYYTSRFHESYSLCGYILTQEGVTEATKERVKENQKLSLTQMFNNLSSLEASTKRELELEMRNNQVRGIKALIDKVLTSSFNKIRELLCELK